LTKSTHPVANISDNRRLSRGAVLFVVVGCLFFFKAIIDPWGVSAITQEQSASVSLALVAPWYRSKNSAETTGDLISVMLIDEAYVKAIGSTYPLPYAKQDDLLSTLIYRDPVANDGSDGEEIFPLAIMLDLIYADNRGALATFGETLRYRALDETRVGLNDPDGILAASGASLYLSEPTSGLLAADEIFGMPGQVAETTEPPTYHRQRTSQIDLPSYPSLLADGVLRYALAPDGIPSSAVMLAVWACAALPKEQVDVMPGCEGGGLIQPAAIRDAAYAAASARVAKRCARLASEGGSIVDACREAATRYAANADWAPGKPVQKSGGQIDRQASILRAFSVARRDGAFEGAMAGSACAEPKFSDRFRSNDAESMADRIAARCTASAEAADRRRIGPAMTVFWAASPRDGGPVGEEAATFSPIGRDAPAAPHTWTTNSVGARTPDACLPYRFEQSFGDRFSEMTARMAGFVGWPVQNYPSLCSYHAPINPQILGASNPEISRWVNSRVNNKIVIIGASVTGMRDVYEMRGVNGPGAWAHAMALDNLLALGSSYRPATFAGIGFVDGFSGQTIQVLLELICGFGIGMLFFKFKLKTFFDRCAARVAVRLNLSVNFAQVLTEGVIGILLATSLMLLLSITALLMIPVLPPLDWIGISALAVTAWALADSTSNEHPENPEAT